MPPPPEEHAANRSSDAGHSCDRHDCPNPDGRATAAAFAAAASAGGWGSAGAAGWGAFAAEAQAICFNEHLANCRQTRDCGKASDSAAWDSTRIRSRTVQRSCWTEAAPLETRHAAGTPDPPLQRQPLAPAAPSAASTTGAAPSGCPAAWALHRSLAGSARRRLCSLTCALVRCS